MLCFTPQSEPNGLRLPLEMMVWIIYQLQKVSGMKSPRFVLGLDKRTCFGQKSGKTHDPYKKKSKSAHLFGKMEGSMAYSMGFLHLFCATGSQLNFLSTSWKIHLIDFWSKRPSRPASSANEMSCLY